MRYGILTVALMFGLAACRSVFHQTTDTAKAGIIIADYVQKEQQGKPYLLYFYTDSTSQEIILRDPDRSIRGNKCLVYFLDQMPGTAWPHACKSIWISRQDGSFRVEDGNQPLYGAAPWKLVNNLWNEEPRLGMGNCMELLECITEEDFFYKYNGKQIRIEHQCLTTAPSTESFALSVNQSKDTLHILAVEQPADSALAPCIRHYGFELAIDSLRLKVDSLYVDLESLSIDYRLQTVHGGARNHFFSIPTKGQGKIRLAF